MKEPSYTCPLIDAAISTIDSLCSYFPDKSIERCTVEDLTDLVNELDDFNQDAFNAEMEDIRSANQDLRDYGNYWEARARELEEKIAELERELEESAR